LFTQCPKCETIFKLSAEVLRAAAGEVRCGRCGEIFNALASLAEEPRAFTKGESPQEQEARADNILRFVPAENPPKRIEVEEVDFSGSPGTQIAHLEIQGAHEELLPWSAEGSEDAEAADSDDDASLEFTLPPGELDRIFIEARPRPVPRPPGSARIDVEEFEPATPEDIRHDLSDQLIDSAAANEPDEHVAAIAFESPPEASPPAPATSRAAAPHPESIEQILPEPQWVDEVEEAHPHKALWISAAIALAVLLAVQIVHQDRQSLAQAAGIGGALRSVYSAIGNPIPLQVNLAAFEVRQWGVTGDASANGTLRVRASVINTGDQAQPYPLLRLTLADRFGSRIGTRDFLPKEYLKKDPERPLEPRERADVVVEIVDPGKTAEGFEIDVCARMADGRIACANDDPAQLK